ncbi:MAG TPA: sigma 54-interacting transcriptional regulator [Vicinamibacterales bacterium]|nr:sigma 54-interacting transcriptional regulator [Vicinamibacterales bacterium]
MSIATDVPDALQLLGTRRFSLVVVDLAAERAALATVRLLRAQFPAIPVIGVIDTTQPLVASEAIDAGVTDLLPWPFDERDIAAVQAAAADAMPVDPSPTRADLVERLYDHSPSMRPVVEAMRAAAARRTGVLISGEAGSGRHLVARTLHDRDHEFVNRPFIVVDCSVDAGPDLEKRLFGTASDPQPDPAKAGPERVARGSAVVAAQGGSLFLTNLPDAPARVQIRLARLLRDREALSGDHQDLITLDFRPIASIGPDADTAMADGRLRRDLADRLGQVRVAMPPLRSRRLDLPLLAAHALRQACEEQHCGPKRFSRAALTLLSALPWPGNGRELREVVAATVEGTRARVIQLEDVLRHASLESAHAGSAAAGLTLRDARAIFEREYIGATLTRCHGRVGDAAQILGIQRTNLYRKVRQLNVPRALLSSRK